LATAELPPLYTFTSAFVHFDIPSTNIVMPGEGLFPGVFQAFAGVLVDTVLTWFGPLFLEGSGLPIHADTSFLEWRRSGPKKRDGGVPPALMDRISPVSLFPTIQRAPSSPPVNIKIIKLIQKTCQVLFFANLGNNYLPRLTL